ncbi:dihydrofolate reductase [Coxiella-like endosymbiont]|uniref:dihydrofolate reductase n=1 Tax=Coxiella-like endosymbiont TaxID=1592897 RepID=UPI00272B4E87|nr:dihydrofolate reductase [Coxiella-like endosymbiont]
MLITLVAAMDKNRLIGQRNQLPWHLPADLAHFKSVTLGKPIIMGRKTFESIEKPLPLRHNIVISRQPSLRIEGCKIFSSVDEALNALADESEVMIIGGGRLFKETLPKAHKMILTIIEHSFEGDIYFPLWNADKWIVVSKIKHGPNENNLYAFSFLELRRKMRITEK